MKILQVLTDKNIGGAGIYLSNLLDEIDYENYKIEIILPRDSLLIEQIKHKKCKIHEMDIKEKSLSIGDISKIYKKINEIKPHIVHTHASLSARIASKISFCPILYTKHCMGEQHYSYIKKISNNFLADIAIGVSKSVCEDLKKSGIKREKIRLIYNGVSEIKKASENEVLTIKNKYNVKKGVLVFGVIARLSKEKGHEFLLKSFKNFLESKREAQLVIAGDGLIKDDLIKLAKELGISENISFLGHVDKIEDIHKIIDVLIVPSEKEAFGLSLAESMSLKKPAIITNSGGVVELVEKDKSAFVVDFNDESDMSKKMQVLADDIGLRIKMGNKAYEIYQDKFRIEEVAEKTMKIYQDIITGLAY